MGLCCVPRIHGAVLRSPDLGRRGEARRTLASVAKELTLTGRGIERALHITWTSETSTSPCLIMARRSIGTSTQLELVGQVPINSRGLTKAALRIWVVSYSRVTRTATAKPSKASRGAAALQPAKVFRFGGDALPPNRRPICWPKNPTP